MEEIFCPVILSDDSQEYKVDVNVCNLLRNRFTLFFCLGLGADLIPLETSEKLLMLSQWGMILTCYVNMVLRLNLSF